MRKRAQAGQGVCILSHPTPSTALRTPLCITPQATGTAAAGPGRLPPLAAGELIPTIGQFKGSRRWRHCPTARVRRPAWPRRV